MRSVYTLASRFAHADTQSPWTAIDLMDGWEPSRHCGDM